MRKHFLKILCLFIFFLSPIVVKANFGDMRYEITRVDINDSRITFNGWAYIHRTHNYITVGNNIKSGGDQKVIMQAYNGTTLISTQSNTLTEDEMTNYNFYCELFYRPDDYIKCTESNYKNSDVNVCKNDSNGVAVIGNNQCYYEDINFKIVFDISGWNVSDLSDITFKIAVSNADFENKIGRSDKFLKYGDDFYTIPETVSIADAAVSNKSNDYITIKEETLAKKVEFIASTGILYTLTNSSNYFKYSSGTDVTCTYGSWKNNTDYEGCSSNIYQLDSSLNYIDGRSNNASSCSNNSFLGSDCKGTYYYAIKVKNVPSNTGRLCAIACPSSEDGYAVAIARGSHVKPTGTFSIKVKNDKKCPVTNPLPNELSCNSSGTLSSTCEELTVHTDKGSAIVKIEQTGTVSSVLTPGRIYNGGGFNFGIMYQNNIKWSYVGGYPGDTLHAAINSAMNDKLKDYDSYVAGINISNLNLDGESISSGMVKQCFSSSNSKDYYGDNGLTVACIFTFPGSSIAYDGKVSYNTSSSININNRYYIPFDKLGNLDVTATIGGMDRITDEAAKSDADEKDPNYSAGVHWTGNWEDSIDGCEINVYPLLYDGDGKYKFIYRPIDVNNPFPNRNAGINWYDWFEIENNRDRLENTYSNGAEYTANINNNTLTDIKNYNKNKNYLDWSGISDSGKSEFVDEYVTRGDGS